VERSFVRRIRIPQGIHKESIQCNLDERGHLQVLGQKVNKEQPAKRSIPIGFKQAPAAVTNSHQ
jgi:HSP20 family molecular chaperone IbpA